MGNYDWTTGLRFTDPGLVDSATEIVSTYNITLTTAVKLFIEQIVKDGKIPFHVEVKTNKLNQEALDFIKEMDELSDMLNPKDIKDFVDEFVDEPKENEPSFESQKQEAMAALTELGSLLKELSEDLKNNEK